MDNKFKDMGLKERVEYVWDYYKFHIFCVIATAALIATVVDTLFINPADKRYMGVAVMGIQANGYASDELGQRLTERMTPPPGYAVIADYFLLTENLQLQLAMTQKFATFLSMGELDIIIADRNEFDVFAADGLFRPLDEVLTAQQLSSLEQRRIGVYGLDMQGVGSVAELRLDRPAVGVPVSSMRPELTVEAIMILFED